MMDSMKQDVLIVEWGRGFGQFPRRALLCGFLVLAFLIGIGPAVFALSLEIEADRLLLNAQANMQNKDFREAKKDLEKILKLRLKTVPDELNFLLRQGRRQERGYCLRKRAA